jgi:hypothetical protein
MNYNSKFDVLKYLGSETNALIARLPTEAAKFWKFPSKRCASRYFTNPK